MGLGFYLVWKRKKDCYYYKFHKLFWSIPISEKDYVIVKETKMLKEEVRRKRDELLDKLDREYDYRICEKCPYNVYGHSYPGGCWISYNVWSGIYILKDTLGVDISEIKKILAPHAFEDIILTFEEIRRLKKLCEEYLEIVELNKDKLMKEYYDNNTPTGVTEYQVVRGELMPIIKFCERSLELKEPLVVSEW